MELSVNHLRLITLPLLAVLSGFTEVAATSGTEITPGISWSQEAGFTYSTDQKGNRIPDYSYCGYRNSTEDIPDVPVRLVVPPVEGDATACLQAAIDRVSALPPNEHGFRGTILLQSGTYRLRGRLRISASGVVIRGMGTGGQGTILRADGTSRMTLIRIAGSDDMTVSGTRKISGGYVPAGSNTVQVEGDHAIQAGDRVLIHRPSTREWITALSMSSFGGETSYLGWKPGERDIYWERSVTAVDSQSLSLDIPLTAAIDSAYGGGEILSFSWPGRIRNIGIENLKLVSACDVANQKDEAHCWMAITMENTEDAWVRRVEFSHFAGSAVALYETASRITIEDCISLSPVSEIGGQRRYTFFTMGQQCLFQRLYAEYGYHDYSAGFCAAGPNAFVDCVSYLPHSFSGAIDSWASGLLFDLVRVDGQAIRFMNRGQDAMGAGWCAANSMLWQCSAARIDCYKPPTAFNWAYGCWSQYAGDARWEACNNHISPRSLFYAQLAERLGRPADFYADRIMPFHAVSSTSPTSELAAELDREAYSPDPQLVDWIRGAGMRDPIRTEVKEVPVFTFKATLASGKDGLKANGKPATQIQVENGWLVRGGRILSGGRLTVPWWRGDARPYAAVKAGPAITRFVPGRYGHGYTDHTASVAAKMADSNLVVLEHNSGLWYDRRRDDHQRVRRMDGEVWAPFYEQPFARSGKGIAWDGLSKYDLTMYNGWYWDRLREFAEAAEQRGLLLLHYQYFQHNILEAGAHYADFPWRTANNINATDFPEPPNYAGDKRIFMDGQFYDTLHPVRKELHRKYIRKCLQHFAGVSNVIQVLSAEYTGPLPFMQFWLNVIREWEQDTGHEVLVALSATKDVQDAILNDPALSRIVDVIDLRYWAYRTDGSLYAPAGGKHMAPRQHARKTDPGQRSFEQVYRAVKDYRLSHPDKAVICSEPGSAVHFWGVLLAGGSLPDLPAGLPDGLLESIAGMDPSDRGIILDQARSWIHPLSNNIGELLYYDAENISFELDLRQFEGKAIAHWIDPATGEVTATGIPVEMGRITSVKKPSDKPFVLWLSRMPLK